MPLRTLRGNSELYETKNASEVLFENVAALYPTPAARSAVREFLIQHCWESQEAIIEKALTVGFDPSEVQDKAMASITRVDSRNGFLPSQLSQVARRLGPVGAHRSREILLPLPPGC